MQRNFLFALLTLIILANLLFHLPMPLLLVLSGAAVIIIAYLWLERQEQTRPETTPIETDKSSGNAKVLRKYEEEVDAFKALAEGMEIAIIVCNISNQALYANSVAQRTFNFTDYENKTLLELTLNYDIHNLVNKVIEDRQPVHQEITARYPSELIFTISIWLQTNADNDIIQIFIGLRDITQLRKLEQVRSDFVANVSHEMRTPLSSIRSIAETILDDPNLDSKLKNKWLNTIITETERLARTASDLLELTKAESYKTEHVRINLSDTANSVLDQMMPNIKKSGLSIRRNIASHLPIIGNSDQIQQVIINLVDNAIKYTQEGSITIKGWIDGGYVVLAVEDTGIGIMSENLPRLFERFYRVDKSRSRDTGGTGLGLSIVKHVVESHGGTVSVQSEFRKGSVFTVKLPMAN